MERERAAGHYHALAWLATHLAYDLLLLRIIPSLLLTTIVYWMVGLNPSAQHFFQHLLISVIYAAVAGVFGALLGALWHDLSLAILFNGLQILFSIAFGGFLLNLNTVPPVLRWIRWLCPLKYALEATSSNELIGLQLVDTLGGVPIRTPVSLFSSSLFAYQEGSYYRDLLVLALPFLVVSGSERCEPRCFWLATDASRLPGLSLAPCLGDANADARALLSLPACRCATLYIVSPLSPPALYFIPRCLSVPCRARCRLDSCPAARCRVHVLCCL